MGYHLNQKNGEVKQAIDELIGEALEIESNRNDVTYPEYEKAMDALIEKYSRKFFLKDWIQKTFEEAYRDFMKAGWILSEVWGDPNQDNDRKIKYYPKYLPSFDEFMVDMGMLIDGR